MELYYFLILLVLLVVTRACGELAERVQQPALVGELVAGIILGVAIAQFPQSLYVVSWLTESKVFGAITDLGIFFLMLLGGLELRPRKLVRASKTAVGVAVAGFVVPLALGFGLAWIFLPASSVKLAQCLFVATALAITAVPVAIKVLMDLGRLNSRVGQMIVSAAVFDDVLSLILLAVLVGVLRTGDVPGLGELALLGLKIVIFFSITIAIGVWGVPRLGRLIARARIEEFEFSALLITGLAYSLLAEALDLHFILGAFLAGLFLSRRTVDPATYDSVKVKVSGITSGFLAPIFFASIGLHLDLSAVTQIPLFLALLIFCAFLGKLGGAGLVAWAQGMPRREAAAVGMGMSARGAVELIIADIAFRAGLFSMPDPPPPIVANLFSAIVIVAVVTTLAAPLSLRWALGRSNSTDEARGGDAVEKR